MPEEKIELEIDNIEDFLNIVSYSLEPETHCCECTPGKHSQRHLVHIQYPDCNCESNKYILNINK